MSEVRPGRQTDLPRLREIQTAALAEPWPAILELAVGDGPLCVVVEPAEAERAVGYAVVLTADAAGAYLPELAVHPDAQGQGYGSALLADVIRRLRDRDVARLRLTVRDGDRRARSFYVDHGFAVVDRVPDHFAAGDGLVLEYAPGDGVR